MADQSTSGWFRDLPNRARDVAAIIALGTVISGLVAAALGYLTDGRVLKILGHETQVIVQKHLAGIVNTELNASCNEGFVAIAGSCRTGGTGGADGRDYSLLLHGFGVSGDGTGFFCNYRASARSGEDPTNVRVPVDVEAVCVRPPPKRIPRRAS